MTRILAVLIAALLSAASAHATVKTDAGSAETLAGKFETYRLQVPAERDSPTVRVRLLVPDGVTVTSFMSVSGFLRTVERGTNGRVTAVTWTGRIHPDEFQRFLFSARNPAEAGVLRWAVEQTYADGTVVRWDDHLPDTPASRTTVK